MIAVINFGRLRDLIQTQRSQTRQILQDQNEKKRDENENPRKNKPDQKILKFDNNPKDPCPFNLVFLRPAHPLSNPLEPSGYTRINPIAASIYASPKAHAVKLANPYQTHDQHIQMSRRNHANL